MDYQELTNKCKKAYKNKDLSKAYKYWSNIHDLLTQNLNKTEDYDNKLVCYQEYWKCMEQFEDKEVYDITDYGKRKAFLEQGLI